MILKSKFLKLMMKNIDFEGFKMRVIVIYFRVFKNKDKIFILNKIKMFYIVNSI